ncbi:MAG: 2-hydroxy-3-oxopropionate reductase [Gammaproteobacteria bacterium]|nr:2-hydroxy-3-oxopropionate reductase [Gammaproteobacteria bacterium]|tara:strand:- start:10792 stop:11667 length:876 start_codon:yes stop_codon:yes gene_type:complete
MQKAIGFVGLGIMGFPMAGHLVNAGYKVSVFNRTIKKSKDWQEKYNGTLCKSLSKLAKNSDVIILCVGNDNDVKDIINGKDGLIDHLKPGTILIDHTTTSAELPKELNHLLELKKVKFLDAPISGGQVGAESGKLSVMIGGNKESFQEVQEIINSYSKFTKYMGKSGSGQLTKMVNQICIAGLIQALAEGMNFSEQVGLNTKDVIEVISKGAAQSWQMENRWETMVNNKYDHGFAVDLMRKDLDIVLKKAKETNISLDITKIINDYYKEIQNMGGGMLDTSSLLKRIKDLI